MPQQTSRVGAPASNPVHTIPTFSTPRINPYLSPAHESSTVSRKRPRSTGYTPTHATPDSSSRPSRDWSHVRPHTSTADSSASLSPPPLTNTSYRLAGGLDAPTAAATARFEDMDVGSENEFRRRWTTETTNHASSHQVYSMSGLERERNGGRRRGRSSVHNTSPDETWGNYVFRMAGGIAGAMWDFCKDTAFIGFKAGGGISYDWRPSDTPRGGFNQAETNYFARESTPVPGQFPSDEYEEVDANSPSSEMEGRPAKRLQTSQGRADDWVVVNNPSSPWTNDPPSRNAYATQSPASAVTHKSRLPRYSPSSRASLNTHSRSSTARLSSNSMTHTPKPQKPGHARTASYASPRSTVQSSNQISHSTPRASFCNQNSPVSAELQRYTEQRDREERQADARMRKMNKQLKSMIAEGQRALSMKVEVDDENGFGLGDESMNMGQLLEDEGYGEGESDGYGRGGGW